MFKRRFPAKRVLLAAGLPFALLVVVLNFSSALGASEAFKDVVVIAGLLGMLAASVIVLWKAYKGTQTE